MGYKYPVGPADLRYHPSMKFFLTLTTIALLAITANAQARTISEGDFNGALQYAGVETNKTFPFIYTTVTDTYQKGVVAFSERKVVDQEAEGAEREITSVTRIGKTFTGYSILTADSTGPYCSKDGASWTGPSNFACGYPGGIFIPPSKKVRDLESAEYSIAEDTRDGEPVKAYRKLAIYAPDEPNGKKTFVEEIATIDSRGFFLTVTTHEGILEPRTTTLFRRQTWDHKTKFKPVVAPK